MNSRADEELITSYIYNAKLKELMLEQALASGSETYLMEKTRHATSLARLLANRGFIQLNQWKNSLMKYVSDQMGWGGGSKEEKGK